MWSYNVSSTSKIFNVSERIPKPFPFVTALNSFERYFTYDMIELIINYSNQVGRIKYNNFKDSYRYLENIIEDLKNEQSKIDEERINQMGRNEEDELMAKNLFGIESYKLRR